MKNSTICTTVCPVLSESHPAVSFEVLLSDTSAFGQVRAVQPVRAGGVGLAEGGLTPISCPPQLVNFGFDTILLLFKVDWSACPDLFVKLEEKKLWIQSGLDQEEVFHLGDTEVFRMNLQRTGKKYMRYHLKTGDISLFLDPRLHTSTVHNMELHIGSLSSQQNVLATIRQLKNWIAYLGGVIHEEKTSRFDICADFQIEIDETGIFNKRRHISRCKKKEFHSSTDDWTGITVGKGDFVFRAYDKQLEMKEKQNFEKVVFFNDLWKTKPNQAVTRFEFQLRRGAIKEIFPLDSPFEVIAADIASVWRYLTEGWFRLADSDVDRENNNQSHVAVSSFWRGVQDACLFKVKPAARNRKQKHINIPALRKQIAGCVLSVAAGVGHAVDDIFGIMITCREIIQEEVVKFMQEPTYLKRFATRQATAMVTF